MQVDPTHEDNTS